MPLPSQEDIEKVFESSEDEDGAAAGNQAASESLHRARAAGVIVEQPDPHAIAYMLGQPSQTQDTLIPTQVSEANHRQHMLSQLSTTQGTTRGSEFDELERVVRERYSTQTQTQTQKPRSYNKGSNSKAKSKNPQNKGRPAGVRGYTEEERLHFLDILERRLPCSGTEWSLVANEHAEMYPDNERNVDSLQRQYQSLLRRREPTGDPNCPPDVKKAKAIDRLLKAKQRAGDISEENGGPIAALAGMEVRQSSDDTGGRANDSASVMSNVTGLVQKRSSPKNQVQQGSSSLIESLISFQMIQSQKEDQRREEDRQRREEREIREQKRYEEELRRHEEVRCRREEEQRRRDERREDMFLKMMTVGIAAFSGNRLDPSSLLGTFQSTRGDGDESSHKRRKRNEDGDKGTGDSRPKDDGSPSNG